jgi:uncharacterized protein YdaU (DUF1376 family)
VNFYPFHIGDYTSATAHLSMIEDSAYRRLLDIYYTRESPIPADMKQACRLVRAQTKEERTAVESVLAEFFTLTAEGWRHARCDAEIAVHNDKRAKASRSAAGRWAALQMAKQSQSESDANAMRTHSERNADAVRRQCYQDQDQDQDQDQEKARIGAAGEISRALREKGIQSNPMEPRLLALAKGGITPALAAAAAEEAKRVKGPGARIPPAYVYAVLDRWLAEPESRPQSAYDPAAEAQKAMRMMEERDAKA